MGLCANLRRACDRVERFVRPQQLYRQAVGGVAVVEAAVRANARPPLMRNVDTREEGRGGALPCPALRSAVRCSHLVPVSVTCGAA